MPTRTKPSGSASVRSTTKLLVLGLLLLTTAVGASMGCKSKKGSGGGFDIGDLLGGSSGGTPSPTPTPDPGPGASPPAGGPVEMPVATNPYDVGYTYESFRGSKRSASRENTTFRAGDKLLISARPTQGGHLYIYDVSEDGALHDRLFPAAGAVGPRGGSWVPANHFVQLPGGGRKFEFAAAQPHRRVYYFLSPFPIPELENGVPPTTNFAAALTQIESRRRNPSAARSRGLTYEPAAPPPGPIALPDFLAMPVAGGDPVIIRVSRLSQRGDGFAFPEIGRPLYLHPSSLAGIGAPTPLPTPTPGGIGRTVALLVADTESNIGASVALDLQNMDRLLRESVPSDRLIVQRFSGRTVEPRTIVEQIRSLPVGPDDVVVFHYAGHGGFSTRDNVHFLALDKGGDLRRDDLLNALLAKRGRLTLVLTDCCANSVNKRIPKITTSFTTDRPDPARFWADLTSLSGVIDINAAGKGEYAQGDTSDGGCFTVSFAELIRGPISAVDENRDGRVSWSEFFPRLQAKTYARSQVLTQGSSDKTERPHQPQYFRFDAR